MTAAEFRAVDTNRLALQELLQNPILQQAIIILRDGYPIVDALVESDAICSVRILSSLKGYNYCIEQLLSLTQPNTPEQAASLGEPDYGAPNEPIP